MLLKDYNFLHLTLQFKKAYVFKYNLLAGKSAIRFHPISWNGRQLTFLFLTIVVKRQLQEHKKWEQEKEKKEFWFSLINLVNYPSPFSQLWLLDKLVSTTHFRGLTCFCMCWFYHPSDIYSFLYKATHEVQTNSLVFILNVLKVLVTFIKCLTFSIIVIL